MSTDKWLFRPRPLPTARLRLYCFCHAGGVASSFRHWTSLTPPDIEVCAVQLPGRETRAREAPFTELEPLLDEVTSLITTRVDRPFAFFGHSLGALLAFEVARRLRLSVGEEPVRLFASAHCAPHLAQPRQRPDSLSDAALVDQMRRLGGVSDAILNDAAMVRFLLAPLRSDMEVMSGYHYRPLPPLTCALSAIAARDDTDVRPEEVESWRQHTRGQFDFHLVPGGHFYLHESLPDVIALVVGDLVRAGAPIRPSAATR